MDQMTHSAPGQTAEPHAAHKMSEAHGSHDRHAGHSVAMFRDKFWLSFALTIPVVFWSTDVQHWIGYRAPSFPGSKFIPAILGVFVFVYGGLVFVRGSWGELADRKPGMMTLISLAIIVAFGTSLAATFGLFEIEVWWELASLITIMVLGHWLEMRAITQARGALDALAALLPDTAERVSGTETETVPISKLKVGDVVLVRPGARVPADGTVVDGAADVDESMITGESKTVPKMPGAKVIAGTVVSGGSLHVRTTAIGDQTALSGIMRLVATAQASGSRTQALADRAAALLILRRSGFRRDHFRLLVVCRRQRTCADQNSNGPHHRLPARSWIGDSACYRDLDFTRSSKRSSCEGQARTRTCPQLRHGDFR
jgi:Cu2+-exporting ATPase